MNAKLFSVLALAVAFRLVPASYGVNPVAWYRFEGNALDAAGANHPSFTQGLNYVPGKVGSGVSPGVSAYIEVPHTPGLANQRFTFEAWVRPDGIGPNNDSAGSVIMEKDRDGSFYYGLAWLANGKFLFATGSGAASRIYSVNNFPMGCGLTFYHVVATYDGAAFRLYVNGNLEGQRLSTAPIDYSGPYPWAIGASPKFFGDVGFPRTWVGIIDEVKIYNQALSLADIQANFAAGGPATACACPALWVSTIGFYPGPKLFHIGGANSTPCCNTNFFYMLNFGNSGSVPSLLNGVVNFLLPQECTFVGFNFAGPPPPPPWIFLPPPPPTPPLTGGGVCTVLFNGPVPPLQQWTINIEVALRCDITESCEQQVELLSEAVIMPFVGDCNITDNIFDHRVVPCCSWDPNDCLVTPKGCGPAGLVNREQVLTYLVRFQNFGGGAAHLVVVRDTLAEGLDPNTVRILGTSHRNMFQVNGRELTWTFPNIELASRSVDEKASHGYVRFQVRPRVNAALGTLITNSAEITFDANAPITTVITTNTITLDPMPVAAFSVAPHAGSAGHTNDFHYSGGTIGASYLWNFGPDAQPRTSTVQNPTGVVFHQPGPHLVSLRTRLGECESEPAVQLVTVGRPGLSIARTTAGPVLSWAGDGYRIQETDDLTPPIQWRPASSLPIAIGGWYFVQMPPPGSMRFYRLAEAQ